MRAFRLWSAGISAALSRPLLLVPLACAEFIAAALVMMVSLWVGAHFTTVERTDEAFTALLHALQALEEPSFWTLALAGYGLAAAGAWLVRNAVHPGVVAVLGDRLRGIAPAPVDAFERGLLDGVVGFLGARILGGLMVAVVTASSFGMLVAGGVLLVESPGVVAALALAAGGTGLLLVPMFEAAMLLGACRSVLHREGPLEALGDGFSRAVSNPLDLLVPWYGLAVAEGIVELAAAVGFSIIAGLATTAPLELVAWGPRLGVVALVAAVRALVAVARLGTLSALAVAEELPEPPSSPLPTAPTESPGAQDLPKVQQSDAAGAPADEPIYEAVAVESPPAPHRDG